VNKKNLTKNDITLNLKKKTGYSFLLSKKLTNDFINILIHNIYNKKFNLKNIGSFKIINKNERLGRNPKSKEKFVINSRKSIIFKASNKLTNSLN
jgi:integration host factor subunit alpha